MVLVGNMAQFMYHNIINNRKIYDTEVKDEIDLCYGAGGCLYPSVFWL